MFSGRGRISWSCEQGGREPRRLCASSGVLALLNGIHDGGLNADPSLDAVIWELKKGGSHIDLK